MTFSFVIYCLKLANMKALIFILSMCLIHINGQTPGDAQTICRTEVRYPTQHDWIPYMNDTSVGVRGQVKWQVLLDQYDYQYILGANALPPGVWTSRDCDGDGRQVFTNTVKAAHGSCKENTLIADHDIIIMKLN